MKHSVTAVVPVYNAEKYIGKTLESLLNQTCPLDEIIIIDDCSTDDTLEIIKNSLAERNGSTIRVVRNEKNSGASFSRNRGIELSKTEWILFMDADDVGESHLVERLLERYNHYTMDRCEPYLLIHSAYSQINELGSKSELITRFQQVGAEEILGYELVRNHIYLSGTLVKRDALVECGGFDPGITYCEDWDLWLKLAAKGGFVYVDEPLFYVRRHSTNVSKNIQDVLQGEKVIISKYSLSFIEEQINKRNLSKEKNFIDFISILYKFDFWEEGYLKLSHFNSENPGYSSGYFYSGLYHLYKSQTADAKQSFAKATELNDYDAASWNNLGVCYALENDKANAVACFTLATEIIKNYMDSSHNLMAVLNNPDASLDQLKITWRELRPVLLQYES
ncbi:glycosyltransferase [Paenibacillus sp. KS-LC4]|uniref:glycosyltransferase n=1 Tax=Paenibacillus sp. KS-LC4 TaxID=2979727 RepID=UPI0030D0AD7D